MARLPAGTRRRPDGTLEKRISIDGKRYSIYGSTAAALKEKEADLRKRLEEGGYTTNSNITLDKFFEEWRDQKRNTVKGNTIAKAACYYNKHISPVLGKKRIRKIERRELLKLQADLSQKNLKPSTINGIFRVLQSILNEAAKEDIIAKNPAARIKALKEPDKATETYHRALTIEEQRLFLEAVKGDYYSD